LSDSVLEPHVKLVEKTFQPGWRLWKHSGLNAPSFIQRCKSHCKAIRHCQWMDNYKHFIALLINYQAQASPFPSTFFTKVATKLSQINWWKALRSYKPPNDILELGVKLLSCPASSTSIEWIFSNLGNIHTEFCNEMFWNF